MREDEKQVDGPDLEREQEKETLVEDKEEELLPDAGEQARAIDQERSGMLLGAMRMILDKQQLLVSSLHLPQREERALEALQAAVSGRTSNTDRFVYAEDRRSMLEQALAVLQPNLAGGDKTLLAEMHEQMSMLTRRVSEVRNQLEHLEEAQEGLSAHEIHANKAEAGDTDDKPKPTPSDLDAPNPAPSSPSSLVGPDLKEAPRPASSLTGPALEQASKPPTSLGDPAEIEAAAKQLPWWRRPLG